MACGARAGGGGGGAVGAEHGLGAGEEALLRVMDSQEDDRLVFFAAFSVLCTRLGVVAVSDEQACPVVVPVLRRTA